MRKNDLIKEIDEDVPLHVTTDPNRLRQILLNLVGNALKFTEKGKVTVKMSVDKENSRLIHISVVDTGYGIAKQDIPKIFKLFGSLDSKE